jgi:uncharacterized membrane protein YraQ (UPF0718 family)
MEQFQPVGFQHLWGGDKWWLVPIAAIIGIPLYIRLSTMIPISQIMIAKGMALGPVMALMISSAGASLPELTLLNSIFKKKLSSNQLDIIRSATEQINQNQNKKFIIALQK